MTAQTARSTLLIVSPATTHPSTHPGILYIFNGDIFYIRFSEVICTLPQATDILKYLRIFHEMYKIYVYKK